MFPCVSCDLLKSGYILQSAQREGLSSRAHKPGLRQSWASTARWDASLSAAHATAELTPSSRKGLGFPRSVPQPSPGRRGCHIAPCIHSPACQSRLPLSGCCQRSPARDMHGTRRRAGVGSGQGEWAQDRAKASPGRARPSSRFPEQCFCQCLRSGGTSGIYCCGFQQCRFAEESVFR